jgi:hypothetical protein
MSLLRGIYQLTIKVSHEVEVVLQKFGDVFRVCCRPYTHLQT